MKRYEAIGKLEAIVEDREDGHLTARHYLQSLQMAAGEEYYKVADNMLAWLNARHGAKPDNQ